MAAEGAKCSSTESAGARRGEALTARSRVPAAAEATAGARRPRIQRLAGEQWGTKDKKRSKATRGGGGRRAPVPAAAAPGAAQAQGREGVRCCKQRQQKHSKHEGQPKQMQREASTRRAAAGVDTHLGEGGNFLGADRAANRGANAQRECEGERARSARASARARGASARYE